jgi:hypothetical protein
MTMLEMSPAGSHRITRQKTAMIVATHLSVTRRVGPQQPIGAVSRLVADPVFSGGTRPHRMCFAGITSHARQAVDPDTQEAPAPREDRFCMSFLQVVKVVGSHIGNHIEKHTE